MNTVQRVEGTWDAKPKLLLGVLPYTDYECLECHRRVRVWGGWPGGHERANRRHFRRYHKRRHQPLQYREIREP